MHFYLLLICILSYCHASTPPQGSRQETNRALDTGARSLSFDSDDEDQMSPRRLANTPASPSRTSGLIHTPYSTRTRSSFSDDEDESRGTSSSGISSGTSGYSFNQQRPGQFRFSDTESDADISFDRGRMSATSGISSDSPSLEESFSSKGGRRSRFFFDESIVEENVGTLVGLESPIGANIAGGTPTLDFDSKPLKLYARHNWGLPYNDPNQIIPMSPDHPRKSDVIVVPDSPDYGAASMDDFISPPRSGPYGPGQIGSLDELYSSPIGGFNIDKNLWPPEDRRYIKIARPPPAPRTAPFSAMSITGSRIPTAFIQAVEYGKKHNNKALSTMKWKKTFISGNSADVFGIELNGDNFVLKISKHFPAEEGYANDITQCVHENDIKSLQESSDPCQHKPQRGLIEKAACSAEPGLVPFEYYIAEKVALTRGLMSAAASVANTFGKDEHHWYLIFEELPGVSPLKYGENILERLAKPLIRRQLEALQQIAACHIMHLDAHWGNILYSHERGIQLIDFGIAALVDRFELVDFRAALVITFTFDRCLDCEASKLGRDFHHLAKSQYPIDGHSLLSHPWLQY
ncbi:unnamed protein product [Adineta ricciae]|uniref:Protein kinase domain-containing protein n=1 Tax=Adineta ricciae TaxID=249248 RepID=A0A815HXU1_ADIRI|nr:unnamed protein product [Adineta ricciae]